MKKNKKTFPKKSLISLYDEGNYQKVISKIKQFTIEGMSKEEILELKLSSIKKLSFEYFDKKELPRTLKLLNQALSEFDDDELKLYKLYALCYSEHFSDALIVSNELINSKNSVVQKEAIFYHALIKSYLQQFNTPKVLINKLVKSRREYLLGFEFLMQNDIENALKQFKLSKPRLKIEKENITALIALLEEKRFQNSRDVKPLYKVLLRGEVEILYPSKNSRNAAKEIEEFFKSRGDEVQKDKFLSFEAPLNVEYIKSNFPLDIQAKAIFNTIILYIQNKNFSTALEAFNASKDLLITLPESIFVYITLLKESEFNIKSINFIDSFLEQHSHLYPYQKNYIFNEIYLLAYIERSKAEKAILDLAKKHNSYVVIFETLPLIDVNFDLKVHKECLEKLFSNYSLSLLKYVEVTLEAFIQGVIGEPVFDTKEFKQKIEILLQSLKETKTTNKKLKDLIFTLLDKVTLLVLNKSFEANKKLYLSLNEISTEYRDFFGIKNQSLPYNLKLLKVALKKEKSPFFGKNQNRSRSIYDYNSPFDLLNDLFKEEDEGFDEYEVETTLLLEDLEEALKNGKQSLNILKKFFKYNDEDIYFETLFEVFKLYKTYASLEIKDIKEILSIIEFDLKYFSTSLENILKDINVDFVYKKQLLEALFELYKSDTQWYLILILYYLEGVNKANLIDNQAMIYFEYLDKVYRKKQFKKIKNRYNKIYNIYSKKGSLF